MTIKKEQAIAELERRKSLSVPTAEQAKLELEKRSSVSTTSPKANIMTEVFDRPAATAREAIRAKPALAMAGPLAGLAALSGVGGEEAKEAAARGAKAPETSKTFQRQMIEKYTPETRSTIINFIGGLPANIAGFAADVATSPAEALATVLPQTRAAKALAKTKPAMAVRKFINKPLVLGKGDKALMKTAIKTPMAKAIRPTVKGRKDFGRMKKFQDDAIDAVGTIYDNVDNLTFVDAKTGQNVNRAPETLEELSSAVSQTKKAIYSQIDESLRQAGSQGVKVQTDDIVDELLKIGYDKKLDIVDPTVRKYAVQQAEAIDALGKLSVSDTEDIIKNLNQSLNAFYKNPTVDSATKANVNAMVANKLRKSLDREVSKVADVSFKDLKKKYGALKSIEEDVTKRAIVESRKSPVGLIDFSDIFSAGDIARGALSQQPGLIAKGALQNVIKSIHKIKNDPNRMVKNMFKAMDKIKSRQALRTTDFDLPVTSAVIATGASRRRKK